MEPGVCLRLWSREIHPTLVPAHRPEIIEADLSGLVLELALWGVDNPGNLRWINPPHQETFNSARRLLQSLGALNPDNRITDHGRQMAALPMHPRLAHMLVAAHRFGYGGMACDLAALLGDRDVVRYQRGHQDADIRIRLGLLQALRRNRPLTIRDAAVDYSTLRRVSRVADQLRRRIGCKAGNGDTVSIGRLLGWAYPERIARRRPGALGKFLLTNGRGAYLDPAAPLAAEELIVAAELDGDRREARIFKAAAYDMDILTEQFAAQLRWTEAVDWDPDRLAVTAQRELKLGALTLRSESLAAPDPQEVLQALLKGIRRQGLDCLPWTKPLRRWQERVCFLRRISGDEQQWPDITDKGLRSQLIQWLAPYLTGMTRLRDLNRVELKTALFSMLPYQQHQLLDELAPTHLIVPSGSRIPIDYSGDVPVLAVRLQEMFGLTRTPSVAGGRQPLLIHLLSPAGRPVQITQDLAGFWQSSYQVIKKELKGRYPKHLWPDDPLRAQATARVRSKAKK
jgi:ATP-dependent helicase HrpB